MTKRENDLKEIAYLIRWHFGSEDPYASYDEISEGYDYLASYDLETEVLVGYVLYTEHAEHLQGLRSGVRRSHRGCGYGTKLYRRMSSLAKRRSKVYRTYTAASNIPSLNSHLKIGMKIERIWQDVDGQTFVSLTT